MQPRFYRIVRHLTAEQQLKQLVAVAVRQIHRNAQYDTHTTEVGGKLLCVGRIGQNCLHAVYAFSVITFECAHIGHKVRLIYAKHYLSPPYSIAT